MSATEYELKPTFAGELRKGDRILTEAAGVVTLTDKALRLSGRGVDQQWVTLRCAEGPEVVVHEGDRFDVIVSEWEVR